MSRNLDWVFRSNGRDLSTAGLTTSVALAQQMLFDGTYLWVTCGTDGIAIYQYFGANSDDEPAWDELDDTTRFRYDEGLSRKLRLVTFIKVTTTQVIRSTCLPALSLFPTLSPSDPDGAYTISGTPVTVTTVANGERVITSTVSRGGTFTALNAFYMATDGTSVFVTNGQNFTEVHKFTIASQDFDSKFTFAAALPDASPNVMNSNLCFASGKLWAVNTFYSDTVNQKLCTYTISGGAQAEHNIPVRPGNTRSWIADGYNGSVYVTNFNEFTVTRYAYAGTFGATIRVNSSPTKVFSFPDKRIFVSSFAGMLSLIDWDDDGVHNDWGTETSCVALQVDPDDSAHLWFVNADGIVARHYLNDSTQNEVSEEDDDWVWNHPRLCDYTFQQSITKSTTVDLGRENLQSQVYSIEDKVYHPDVVITNAAGTVTYVEHIDYTVNTLTGILTFTGTIADGVSLRASYYWSKFFASNILITPELTYTAGASSITVLPHLFVISENVLLAIRFEPYRTHLPAETGVTGQGAVVAGSNQYFGD